MSKVRRTGSSGSRILMVLATIGLFALTVWLVIDGKKNRIPVPSGETSLTKPVGSTTGESEVAENDIASQLAALAEDTIDQKPGRIGRLPATDAEITAAYTRAHTGTCELLPEGQPVQLTTFAKALTDNDRKAKDPKFSQTRQQILSIGLLIEPEDQTQLPALSKQPILNYLKEHYVTVQVRVIRDPVTYRRSLSHRILAATASFSGARITERFEPQVASSVREFRSIGLLVPDEAAQAPESPQTLVMIHKHDLMESGGTTSRPNYEFVFVRATPSSEEGKDAFKLNTFSTTQQRTVLHHLQVGESPRSTEDCSIRSSIGVTSFVGAGLIPSKSSVRKTSVRSRGSFTREKLAAYTKSKGLEGDPFDHLPVVLDAIVAGEITGLSE